jgi:hypothetical protein
MRRRDFIQGITASTAWPLAAHALQAQPRLVGVLMGFAESDASRSLVGEFRGELANAGWKEGSNLRIELRWGGGDVDRIGDAARELVALRPDAILAQTTPVAAALARETRLTVDSLDIAILVHMYHEIAQPYGLLYNLIPALKPGARVGIIDAFKPTSEHGTPPNLLRCELAAVGYREISLDRLTGSDAYLAIFVPPSVESRTRPEAVVACKTP